MIYSYYKPQLRQQMFIQIQDGISKGYVNMYAWIALKVRKDCLQLSDNCLILCLPDIAKSPVTQVSS